MLKIKNITAAYHKGYPILSDVSLDLRDGERIAILGRNGAGKTTFANSIFGLTPLITGEILYKETNILQLPLERITSFGLSYFMQGAPVFSQMTVKENLLMAGD
ncbi:MAG: ATP-binding cassette domain-containing protein, partial [Bacteroidales bacterium]|nr:ATP-binding cassette domain-containing protein [Bacteroidales bacterium]